MKHNILSFLGLAAFVCAVQTTLATTVTTEAQLEAALAAGGAIELGADITLTHELQVDKTVTLDLATYRVTAATAANAFQVISNGNFTVNASATSPGGITTDSDRCCVFTSWGWNPGPKSVTINGGSFFGNFVFNWATDIDAQLAAQYGITSSGGGSGERAVPTTIVINGGTFDGGYSQGNVAGYRCYYFTVNGGTFEKGLDTADTTTCSVGVTATCKAFITGGRYKSRYPWFRWKNRQGEIDVGKVYIGSPSHTNVYYYESGYYVNAYDYSACEATAVTESWDAIINTDFFTYLLSRCCQKWVVKEDERHYFRYLTEAQLHGTDVEPIVQGMSSASLSSPRIASLRAVKSLSLQSTEQNATAFIEGDPNDVLSPGPGSSENYVVGNLSDLNKLHPLSDYDTNFKVRFSQYTKNQLVKDVANDFSTFRVFYLKDTSKVAYDYAGADVDPGRFKPISLEISFDQAIPQDALEVAFTDYISGYQLYVTMRQGSSCGKTGVSKIGGLKANEPYVLAATDIPGPGLAQGSWAEGVIVGLGIPTDESNLKSKHVKATVSIVQTINNERVVRASFTHTFGGSGVIEPEPLEQTEAEVVVHKASDVVSGKDTSVTVVEIHEDGTTEQVVMKQDFGDPRTVAVSQAVQDLGTNSVAATLAEDETGLGQVPVDEEGQAATEDISKFLKIDLTGVAVETPVAGVAPLGAVQYDVTPKLKTITTIDEVKQVTEREISNEEIAESGQSITFKLPLTDDFTASAIVTHKSDDAAYEDEQYVLPVQGSAGGRYVQITTTHFSQFIVAPSGTVMVDSDETLGIVTIPKTALVNNEVAVGVPFVKSPSQDEQTVDTLLVAGYDANDKIRVWNPTKDASSDYDSWRWNGTEWKAIQPDIGEKPGAASTYEVARGKAFWFLDNDGTGVGLTLAGLEKAGAQTTAAAGTTSAPKMTLMVNPFGQSLDIVTKITSGMVTGDEIVLVNGSVRYAYKEGSGWGTWTPGEKTKVGAIWVTGDDVFTPASSIIIPAGASFWYVSKGGSPTVSWD